jgi:hypothetical protein
MVVVVMSDAPAAANVAADEDDADGDDIHDTEEWNHR